MAQKTSYFFCPDHWFVKEQLLDILAATPKEFYGRAELMDKLGCWITIHDRICVEKPWNYQTYYQTFEKVYLAFVESLRELERAVKIREIGEKSSYYIFHFLKPGPQAI